MWLEPAATWGAEEHEAIIRPLDLDGEAVAGFGRPVDGARSTTANFDAGQPAHGLRGGPPAAGRVDPRPASSRPGSRCRRSASLCEEFGVARTSVREAIQGLVTLGVHRAPRQPSRTSPSSLPDAATRPVDDEPQVPRAPTVRSAPGRRDPDRRAGDAAGRRRAARRAAPLAHEFPAPCRSTSSASSTASSTRRVARACRQPDARRGGLKVSNRCSAPPTSTRCCSPQPNAAVVSRIVRESGQAHRAIAKAIVAGERSATVDAAGAHLDQVEERMLARCDERQRSDRTARAQRQADRVAVRVPDQGPCPERNS